MKQLVIVSRMSILDIRAEDNGNRQAIKLYY